MIRIVGPAGKSADGALAVPLARLPMSELVPAEVPIPAWEADLYEVMLPGSS